MMGIQRGRKRRCLKILIFDDQVTVLKKPLTARNVQT